MTATVSGFIAKPTSAFKNFWAKVTTPAKYRVNYEHKSSDQLNAAKVIGKSTTEHDSVEQALETLTGNLTEVFNQWLTVDRDKELTLQVMMAQGKSAQILTINLPSPASFVPQEVPVQ